jgi:hypothetical protein
MTFLYSRTISNYSEDHQMDYQVGQILHVTDGKEGAALLGQLHAAGYYCNFRRSKDGNLRIHIYAHLTPTTRDEDGFFVENDALEEHINYERELAFGRESPVRFFMSNEERQDSEDCLQFVRGRWDKRTPWGDDKLYICSGLLLYSNLEQALKTVIPDFDIYGFDYTLSVAQWEKIKELDKGKYLHQAVAELDAWLGPRTDEEVAMTIICI